MSEDLQQLVNDLERFPTVLYPAVQTVMQQGALGLKDQLNENLAASRHFRGAAGSVTYDGLVDVGAISYEVGPDKGRRGGALANIAFFGTSRGGGTVDLDGAVQAEGDRTEKFLSLAVEGLL